MRRRGKRWMRDGTIRIARFPDADRRSPRSPTRTRINSPHPAFTCRGSADGLAAGWAWTCRHAEAIAGSCNTLLPQTGAADRSRQFVATLWRFGCGWSSPRCRRRRWWLWRCAQAGAVSPRPAISSRSRVAARRRADCSGMARQLDRWGTASPRRSAVGGAGENRHSAIQSFAARDVGRLRDCDHQAIVLAWRC